MSTTNTNKLELDVDFSPREHLSTLQSALFGLLSAIQYTRVSYLDQPTGFLLEADCSSLAKVRLVQQSESMEWGSRHPRLTKLTCPELFTKLAGIFLFIVHCHYNVYRIRLPPTSQSHRRPQSIVLNDPSPTKSKSALPLHTSQLPIQPPHSHLQQTLPKELSW